MRKRRIPDYLYCGLLILILIAGLPVVCLAQEFPAEPFRNLVPERPGDFPQQLPEFEPQDPSEEPLDLPLPPPPRPHGDQLSGKLQFKLKKINLTGNTVFTDEQLAPVLEPYEGRNTTTEDLFKLRNALTQYYIERGYVNSGAIIPDQKVVDGKIEIQIVEGQLTEIKVTGNDWLRDNYIIERLKIGSEDVVNIKHLQDQIKLLQQNRLIDRINAQLGPGSNPGESILLVDMEESLPYDLTLSFNNFRSPSVGEYQGEIFASLYNLTSYGDSFTARYAITEGLDNGAASYSFPISAHNTRLRLFYDRTEADIIEDPFDLLNIESTTESYGASLRHPFYQTPQKQLIGEIIFEKRRSKTTFQFPGVPREPFDFSGVENGKSKVTALRFVQEWVDRSSSRVLALRSVFSWGIDTSRLLDDQNFPINSSDYFAWLGQFQWVQRLADTDFQLVVRGDVQLTPDSLLPLEKFAIGGANSVRGYRQNQFVRDQGAVGSVELRYPVFRLPIPGLSESLVDGTVQFAGFYDIGWSENTNQISLEGTTVPPTVISSAGIGVRWDPHRKIHSELYWGIPFRKIRTGGEHSLQDSGIHFLLNISLF